VSVEDRFNTLAGGLDYPMFIVTVADGDRRAGCLVGFAAQCSIDPPRFMVWLSKKNHTYEVAKHVDTVAVHVPSRTDRALAAHFGTTTGHDTDKFATVPWRPGPDGVPILTGCPQWFAGRVRTRHDTGDHEGLLLDVIATGEDHGRPQLPFQDVKLLSPGHAP
jgi:flavin reductase (DIM6/NTAB) family NADH-FMN oxidoreductase RutF